MDTARQKKGEEFATENQGGESACRQGSAIPPRHECRGLPRSRMKRSYSILLFALSIFLAVPAMASEITLAGHLVKRWFELGEIKEWHIYIIPKDNVEFDGCSEAVAYSVDPKIDYMLEELADKDLLVRVTGEVGPFSRAEMGFSVSQIKILK